MTIKSCLLVSLSPQKAHPCAERRLLTYFAWRLVWGPPTSAVSERKNPKKRTFRSYISRMGRKNPLSDLHKILHYGRYSGRNHPCKFWDRSVQGFKRGEGSNFRLFHRLSPSSLQHSRTTVRVCDYYYYYLLRRSSKTAPEHKRQTYNTLKKQYTEIKQ